jgi:hypothetical protein
MDGSPVDLEVIVSWPQAVVAVVVVLALLVWPGVSSWMTARQARDSARAAHAAIEHEARPNSGSSMKDSLNRLEAGQREQGQTLTAVADAVADQGRRLDVLERAADKRGGRLTWRRR